jgi:hypothetical protein
MCYGIKDACSATHHRNRREVVPDVLGVLKEPSEIIKVGYDLVRAARNEILVILHTANALLCQERAGGLDLLGLPVH